MKSASYAPVYAALYPKLAELFRLHGYALAVHGSLQRDFDVVAIPWRKNVSSHDDVLAAIENGFAATVIGNGTQKNHGRITYVLSIGFGECFVDLSFV